MSVLSDAPASAPHKAEASAEEPAPPARSKKSLRKRGAAEAPAGPAEHETAEDTTAVTAVAQPAKKQPKAKKGKKAKVEGGQKAEEQQDTATATSDKETKGADCC